MKKYILSLLLLISSVSFGSALTNGAQCISTTIPTKMYAGETKTVSVTFKNTGTKTWTNLSPGSKTGNYDASLWPWPPTTGTTALPNLLDEIPGGPSSTVAPGGSVTYSFTVTAPAVAGTYPIAYRMLEQNVAWFGDSCGQNAVVVVPPPKNLSECISTTIPSTMNVGEKKVVTVTFKNKGAGTWTNNEGGRTGNYDMSLWPHPPATTNNTDPSIIYSLPASSVSSGATTTFTFTLTAPTSPGTYPINYRMLEQNVEWFGDACGKDKVVVTQPPLAVKDAQCIAHTIPSTMMAGESKLVSVTFKNTGTDSWANNDGALRGDINVAMPGYRSPQSYIPSTISRLPVSPVKTGEQVTLNFILTATTTPGTFYPAYKMVENNVGFFGESCGPTSATIVPAIKTEPINVVAKASGGATITWNGDAKPAWEPYTIPIDAKITSISGSMTDVIKGSFFDYCANIWRDKDPTKYPAYTGGYSDIFCWSGLYRATNGNFNTSTDLSATPLFVPAGTKMVCSGHTSGNARERSAAKRSCSITYEPWKPNETRYRVLRIPHLDQFATADIPFTGGTYKPIDADHPLRIKGAFYYVAFEGDNATNIMPCVREKDPKGVVIRKNCLSTQDITSGTNYISPGYVAIDWTVNHPNTIDATCTFGGTTASVYGCAFYLITEIPKDIITNGPENTFADYGNTSRVQLEEWCAKYPFITYGSAGEITSRAPNKAKCLELYPKASCLVTPTARCFTPKATSTTKVSTVVEDIAADVMAINQFFKRGVSTLSPFSSVRSASAEESVSIVNQPQTCIEINSNLHRGNEVPVVRKLQAFLLSKGLLNETSVTGFFGDKTIEAVKEYQSMKGLPQTGMVYDHTRQAIKEDTCK